MFSRRCCGRCKSSDSHLINVAVRQSNLQGLHKKTDCSHADKPDEEADGSMC